VDVVSILSARRNNYLLSPHLQVFELRFWMHRNCRRTAATCTSRH